MMPAKAVEFGAASWNRRQAAEQDRRLTLELYDREQAPLRRYLLYLGVDADTAAETVQETFLRLHRHLAAGGDRSYLRAWLYRVAHNLARNAQSSYWASKTNDLAAANIRSEIADPRISAEQELLARESERRMGEALQKLSEAQRNCLVLRAQGLKYREIGEALNLSTSTVGENVQRGLEKLKELV